MRPLRRRPLSAESCASSACSGWARGAPAQWRRARRSPIANAFVTRLHVRYDRAHSPRTWCSRSPATAATSRAATSCATRGRGRRVPAAAPTARAARAAGAGGPDAGEAHRLAARGGPPARRPHRGEHEPCGAGGVVEGVVEVRPGAWSPGPGAPTTSPHSSAASATRWCSSECRPGWPRRPPEVNAAWNASAESNSRCPIATKGAGAPRCTTPPKPCSTWIPFSAAPSCSRQMPMCVLR